MVFVKYTDKMIHRYHWYHICMIKISAAAFVLMIAKLWPPLLSLDWHWYAMIALVTAIIPLRKLCEYKEDGGSTEQ